MKIPEELIIFGAGSIGRGFLGQIFGRIGWRVTFVDVDERLVDALNAAGRYRVRLTSPDGTVEDVDVPNVRAVPARDTRAVAAALRATRYVGTAVGAVGKMVPEADGSSGSLDLATEAMNTLLVDGADWRNPLPQIPWLEPVQPIEAYVDRKLYIHNLIHAAMAFLSVRHRPHCRYIAELAREESVMRVVSGLIEDVSRALAAGERCCCFTVTASRCGGCSTCTKPPWPTGSPTGSCLSRT